MRKICILLMIVVILPLFSVNSSAESNADKYISEFENILPEELSGITESPDKLSERLGVKALLSEVISIVSGAGGEILGFLLTVLGVVLLLGVSRDLNLDRSFQVSAFSGMVCSYILFIKLASLFRGIEEAIASLSVFFASLIPITLGLTALGGGVSTASVQGSGMYLTLMLIGGGGAIFTSVVIFGFVMSLLSSSDDSCAEISRGIKNLFMWILGIATTLLSGTLSLQTVIASAKDTMAMRTAKYMASGIIPVVGSAVSGALSTLASGLAYAKGIVGGGAVLAIISIALSPLVLLLTYRLCISAGVVLADFTGVSTASKILSAYRFSLDTLIALYALSAVLYIYEIILFIKGGAELL